MNGTLKKWEIALMAAVVLALLTGGWLEREQAQLAGSVIRLHVLANSDSTEDQRLKLAVRDCILDRAKELYPQGADLPQARQALKAALPELARAGEERVRELGYSYPVEARLEEAWFPTKKYEGFSLPAGRYEALRVLIGEGKGQNWWCVAFPPICLGAASETLEESVQAGCLTREQVDLICETDRGYVMKFKSLELLGRLQRRLEALSG